MSDYIKRIRTLDGDKQIDYESLANLPDLDSKLDIVEGYDDKIDTYKSTSIVFYRVEGNSNNTSINQPYYLITSYSIIDSMTTRYYQIKIDGNAISVRYDTFYGMFNDGWSSWESFLKSSDIIDKLTDTSSNKPLSANQGKILNDKIGDIDTALEEIIAIQEDLMTPDGDEVSY